MNNRVFGIIGVGCRNGNWNADFSGNPKKYIDEYVASPFALKYAMREYWEQKNFKVFFRKTYKNVKGKIVPNTLAERYLSLYEQKSVPKEDIIIQQDVFSAIDVMNFGGVFAGNGLNSSYTGAVQLTTGINKYDGAETIRDVNLSRFQNANKAESSTSTLGNRFILTEGHYFYGFTINPACYNHLKSIDDTFEGYSDEAYEAFKTAALYSVNNINSLTKVSCFNEFAMFVKMKEGSLKLMSNINDDVKFTKAEDMAENNGLNEIDLTTVMNELNAIADEIESIEIYYNPQLTSIKYDKTDLDKVTTKFNILNAKKEA